MFPTLEDVLNPSGSLYPRFCVLLTTCDQMAQLVSRIRMHRPWISWCHVGKEGQCVGHGENTPDVFCDADMLKDWIDSESMIRPILSVTLSCLATDMEISAVQSMAAACKGWQDDFFVSALITQPHTSANNVGLSPLPTGFTTQWALPPDGELDRSVLTGFALLQNLLNGLLVICSSPGLGADVDSLHSVLTHPNGGRAIELVEFTASNEIASMAQELTVDPSKREAITGWYAVIAVMLFRDASAFRFEVYRKLTAAVSLANSGSELIFPVVCFDSTQHHPLSMVLIGKRDPQLHSLQVE